MYLNGSLAVNEVTNDSATMQLSHECVVFRFWVKNGSGEAVRVTKVEMLAAEGKTGVNTRASLTTAGISHSTPEDITV